MALDARELDGRLQKLRKSLKGLPKDPTVEEVHDLRTRIRRVESILHALEMDSSKNEQRILTHLKVLRKHAGEVRDMDVLTGYILRLKLDDDPDCVVRLVHHLGARRCKGADKLHSQTVKNGPELRQRLKQARRKVGTLLKRFATRRTNLNGGGNEDDEAPLHAMTVALRLSRELAAVPRLGTRNLHAYRIEVKRLRYLLELTGDSDRTQKEFIDHLKRVQDAIGEWHDWMELGDIAHEVLPDHGGCSLLRKIEKTTHQKFSESLHITEQMRRRYLIPSKNGSRGKAGKRQAAIAGPVLVATSEMAA